MDAVVYETDLTAQFLRLRAAKQHRASFKPVENGFSSPSGKEHLLAIEMCELGPPAWCDLVDDCKELMARMQERLSVYRQLCREKNLLTSSPKDDEENDARADAVSAEIRQLLQQCQTKVKKLTPDPGATSWENQLLSNAQAAITIGLRELSQIIRRSHALRTQVLRDSSTKDQPDENAIQPELGLQQTTQMMFDRLYVDEHERHREIENLAKTMTDLHELFASMNAVVADQGTMLDRIDYNIEQIADESAAAASQVKKAVERYKSGLAHKVIVFLSTACLILSFLLILKWTV